MSNLGRFHAWDYDNDEGYTTSAIFYAAKENKLEILKYLITVVEPEKLKQLQLTSPVVAAVMQYMSEFLELLLGSGYDIEPALPYTGKVFLEYTLFQRYFLRIGTMMIQKDRSGTSLKILLK